MDINIEIKEEVPLSDDVASMNQFFSKSETMKTYCGAEFVDSDCDMAIKTEFKSEAPFQNFCAQREKERFTTYPVIKEIKSQTVTFSNNCEVNITTGTGSQNQGEFLPKDPVIKVETYNVDLEVDNKVKIKEEPGWLESENSFVCGDMKDEDCPPVRSPRLCTKAVSGDSFGSSALASTETLMKNASFIYTKDCNGPEIKKSDVKEMPNVEKHLQSSIYNNREIIDKSVLLPHKYTKSHKCEICEKSFTRLSHLKEHNLIHEGKKPHKCEICEKSFTHLSTMKRHKLVHMCKSSHMCEIFEKSFAHLFHLKEHNLIHEGKWPHKCVICEKSFKRFSALKRHNLIHEGIKSHKCEICGKSFTQFSTLKRHNLIHEGIKNHKCEICEKSFTQFSTLKDHYLIHEGKKSHKCETCQKSFTYLSTLKRHNLVHERKKT